MKRSLSTLCALVIFASYAVFAQSTSDSSSTEAAPPPEQRPVVQNPPASTGAFSRMGIGAGFSPLGVGIEVSTNLNQHLNLRGVGNIFKYSTDFTVDGVHTSTDLNLASGGVLLDYYPFHTGFRLSAGMLFVNDNRMSATAGVNGGDSFTLNDQTYYSSSANPLNGTASLALNATKPSAVVTTGWGNHVRRNGHWTVPFEIGAAFVGAPRADMNLTGTACTDPAQIICANVSDPNNPIAVQFQQNLSAQVDKWNNDMNLLKVYPILSAGIAYSFNIRK